MPVHEALKYVIGAYLVFAVLLLAWGVIMASHMTRARQELAALRRAREERRR
jgi:hypothetical protein